MSINDSERRLLAEIAGIADKVRALRAGGVFHDGTQIKALEGQSRMKWDELRALRAGPVNMEPLPTPSNRSPHR